MKFTLTALILAPFSSIYASDADSDVVTLTPSNFDLLIDGSKDALIKFYAPWCGHCKTLAPIYKELATNFKPSTSLIIADLDCDTHKSLCSKYDIKGYPTLKWFAKGADPSKPEDYATGRDLVSLTKFVTEKASTLVKEETFVRELEDDGFEAVVSRKGRKGVIVMFEMPWDSSSQAFKPFYEKIAKSLQNEKHCIIASLDCKLNPLTRNKYNVISYPKFKFFGMKGVEEYTGLVNEKAILEYVNLKCGTFRLITGQLSTKAGLVPGMDVLVQNVLNGVDVESSINDAKELAGTEKYAVYYTKAMEKIVVNESYAKNEMKRLDKIIADKSTASEKLDDFTMRRNILSTFIVKGERVEL